MVDEIRTFKNVAELKCQPQGQRKVCELNMNGNTLRKNVGVININSGEIERVGVSGGELEVDFSPSQTLIYDEKIDVLYTSKVKT